MDVTDSIAPKSDQQNYDDYLAGPRTVTVTDVTRDSEQRVSIQLAEYPGRPYKPAKSMLRVIVAAWGKEASAWAGRRLALYGDPNVMFGGKKVGGIRISHLSHIDGPLTLQLTVTRGKRAPFTVQPLPDAPDPLEAIRNARDMDELRAAWEQAKTVPGATEAKDIRKQELA